MEKTSKGLVEYAKAQLGLPYWYGTFGNIGTEELYAAKKKQYPKYYNWKGTKYDNFPSQYGKRVHDCVGLIKGYLWSDSPTAKPKYNSSQDVSANGMRAVCKEKGSIASMPDVPGVLVFMNGHVGVYIGNGEVIEARGHEYGVVKTALKSRPWVWWGKCPLIDYDNDNDKKTVLIVNKGCWNMRKGPGTGYTVKRVVSEGTQLTSTKQSNGWYYIDQYDAWISPKGVTVK